MYNLQIIARILGLQINKRGNGYHVNRGGYSVGVVYENLNQVSIHLAKKIQEVKAEIDTE